MDITEMWYEDQVNQSIQNLSRLGRFSKIAGICFTAVLFAGGALGVSVAGADDLQKVQVQNLPIPRMDSEPESPLLYAAPKMISAKSPVRAKSIKPRQPPIRHCYTRATEIFAGTVTICDNMDRSDPPKGIEKNLATLTR